MRTTEIEADIIPIRDLLSLNIQIPIYQRSYKWTKKSILQLFYDIEEAMNKDILEYRLGSVILHDADIVDGQQRFISILLLLKSIKNNYSLPNLIFSSNISKINIYNNYQTFLSLANKLPDKNKYFDYLLDCCSVVVIKVKKQALAFQMFDSQNTRGKPLKPHDLLKAYHLREMDKNNELNIANNIIDKWQNINEDELATFFDLYLYQIKHWVKCRRDDYFSSEKISIFKGITINNDFNFTKYHKTTEIFQINQPIIAGKSFFNNILHYYSLLLEIQIKILKEFGDIPNSGERLKNAMRLLERIALLFADRFGINEINSTILRKMFVWAYSPYIYFDAPVWKSYYKFAVGEHNDVPNNMPLFFDMCEYKNPREFNELLLKPLENKKKRKNKNDNMIMKIFDLYFTGDDNE